MTREEPKPQHTYRFCHCGRPLRAGERCDETYDGHRPPSVTEFGAGIVAMGMERTYEDLVERDRL